MENVSVSIASNLGPQFPEVSRRIIFSAKDVFFVEEGITHVTTEGNIMKCCISAWPGNYGNNIARPRDFSHVQFPEFRPGFPGLPKWR